MMMIMTKYILMNMITIIMMNQLIMVMTRKKKTIAIAIASSQPPLKTDIEVVSKTWCKTSKKYKGDVCLGNNLLQSHGETIVSTTSINNQNDGMFNAGTGYSRFINHIKQKLFTKNKKYKYKGLAWEKNSNGKCNKPQ
eukprot:469267_1